MKEAKLSLSQRSSHHFIVTRSPNHWCAISWAMTLGYSMSLIVYLGVPVVLLDRFLLVRFFAQKQRRIGYAQDFPSVAQSHQRG